jgi:FkbM family methyltransferase
VEHLVRIREELVEGVGPWIWPIEDDGAWRGPSEEFASIRDHILKFAKKRQLIVTAGGCCGMYPRLWDELFEAVYTFEPAPLNYYCLIQNCPSESIKKFNLALGEFEQKNWMTVSDKSNVGMGRVVSEHAPEEKIVIDMVSLDSYNLPACDVIQFDLEGYEPAALLGAINTIQTYRPVISIEAKNKADTSFGLLNSWGYKPVAETRFDTIFIPI